MAIGGPGTRDPSNRYVRATELKRFEANLARETARTNPIPTPRGLEKEAVSLGRQRRASEEKVAALF